MNQLKVIIIMGIDNSQNLRTYESLLRDKVIDNHYQIAYPEAYKHPRHHATLLNDLINHQVLKSKTLVITTHSECLILALRLKVSKGELDHNNVIIYNANAEEGGYREIKVDRRGTVDWWPQGIFSEDFDLVRKIREEQSILDSIEILSNINNSYSIDDIYSKIDKYLSPKQLFKVAAHFGFEDIHKFQIHNRNWTDDMEIEFKYALAKHIFSRM